MVTAKPEREYFLDSIRAGLMLLGVPFHVSLIYSSQKWTVNSPTDSLWLTLFNEFIHSFRMQVFFVISGYFSYMLYLRYQPVRWLKVRMERVGIPFLAAIPLITLPQFFMLKAWSDKFTDWSQYSLYQRYNTLVWELISHLWFLLVLLLLTASGMLLFAMINKHKQRLSTLTINWPRIFLALSVCVIGWGVVRRLLLWQAPAVLMDGLFNIAVMQSLFYLPFFLLGAIAWINPQAKALFIRRHPPVWAGAILLFIAYHLNQQYSSGAGWLYELDALISMAMGLCMLNICFSFGYRFLNNPSGKVRYLVNSSLFIYLVHHPLTLVFGLFVMPHIASNSLGFFAGLIFVFGISFLLYEIHLRIPLLRFLFSGKKA
ncbi:MULTISPECIES: glucans biosynthesis protein MdoC [Tatumella]|uniref:Glucans biosynthesis protein C n=1 Tax=Tatumella punctata TaxID=399969 RepID=A0ABW1VLR3_9GAMM|nr:MULTISPECIES: glucans biosynthesis protein MdoC [unclassified Tatumella]MBS0856886.1 glucans biosynthesis protein MdoC [Tatumella sp. JGM16]MBS0877686.1 glucans biosynthesis protein MdoC [Tatumella sp. JGM82]MBS0891391.1 glucans biosynthesis protein MdoC [Tatumella sp. JGM94]MBS0895380.1 glucans biosynthesis protein MdoC [Tatumella sp. JGM130]MBS0902218.1 glucans biosynthesis protein MdoC [Tatumella sp. JGM100]